jgi:hypothetical protein
MFTSVKKYSKFNNGHQYNLLHLIVTTYKVSLQYVTAKELTEYIWCFGSVYRNTLKFGIYDSPINLGSDQSDN